MNYRHAFHAGNFADVVKHALLARVVAHLRKKQTAFRVIDTHAGTGLTDLRGDEARRGGEWQGGIGRVWQQTFDPGVASLLETYLAAIAAYNSGATPGGTPGVTPDGEPGHTPDDKPAGPLACYPGSPLLIRQWLRPQDRLIACEYEPGAARMLAHNLSGDARIKAIAIDGWTALNAYIPPKEKRGLVLIDPPYEQADELQRAAQAVGAAHRKWPGGTILLWYPIKDRRDIVRFGKSLAAFKLAKALQIELSRNAPATKGLRGSGLLVVNAPWTLQDEAQILLPALARAFWPGESSEIRVETVAAE